VIAFNASKVYSSKLCAHTQTDTHFYHSTFRDRPELAGELCENSPTLVDRLCKDNRCTSFETLVDPRLGNEVDEAVAIDRPNSSNGLRVFERLYRRIANTINMDD